MSYNLEEIASQYNVATDFDAILVGYDFEVAKEYFSGRTFLELGCATGESVLKLLPYAEAIDVVEGAEKNIETTKAKVGEAPSAKVQYFHSLWQDYTFPENYYSDVIWFHGIEHIEDPESLLKKIFTSLQPNGRLHVVTPNAFSLHRRVGVAMGLLQDVHELNERDRMVGHVVVFDREQVLSVLDRSGFVSLAQSGIMIKPLPNAKMKELSEQNPALIHAYFTLGKELVDLAAETYICAIKKS